MLLLLRFSVPNQWTQRNSGPTASHGRQCHPPQIFEPRYLDPNALMKLNIAIFTCINPVSNLLASTTPWWNPPCRLILLNRQIALLMRYYPIAFNWLI